MKSGPVTLANISGRPGSYRMLVATARSVEMDPDEWSKIGGIVAGIQFDENVRSIMDRVIQEEGVDHHWVIVLGDHKQELIQLCDLLDIRPVVL
jgi:L-arabinose isomerase